MPETTEFVYKQPLTLSVETSIDVDSRGNKKPSIKVKFEKRLTESEIANKSIREIFEEIVATEKEIIVKFINDVNGELNGD